MANVNEGLEQPAADEKVNSEAGFAAALAGKGVEPDKDENTSDTSVALGLETIEPGKERGPDGRFTAKTETPAPAQDTSNTAAQAITTDDPALAAYLGKYGGDVEKALQAAVEAQSLIGRRDEEREQLRERLAKMEGTVEALSRQPQAPAPPVLTDEQVEERAASLVSAKGGWVEAATVAANEAHASGDSRVYDSLVEQWALESPIQAARFDTDFQLWKREQAAPKTEAAPDPWVEEQKASTGINATMKAIMAEIGKDAFEAITTVGADGESLMIKALDSMPPQVGQMVADDDPQIRLAGAKIVADRAMLLAGTTTKTDVQEVTDEGMPESVRRKLSGASVATAGLRPAPAAPQGQVSKEDAIKTFKEEIMAAETTSVASGLTYGK